MLLGGGASWPAANGVARAQDPPAPYLQTPSPRQLAWHRLEYYAFVHFGPNTFTDEEWGRSQPTPDVFDPAALDTDQWARTFADAGMAGLILTAKHHDGMALWDTNTTAYRVGSGRWGRDRAAAGGAGAADVVRMAAASARRHGLRFGVYLSPWDIHRDPAMPKPQLAGTPYDEPQIFGDASPGGDYNEFYARQLTELVTMRLLPGDDEADDDDDNGRVWGEEGPQVELSEIWLDGASGSDTVQTFDWAAFRDVIRAHQPGAVMWGHQGVDARWVGNEDGVAAATSWHTIDRTQDDERYSGDELQAGVRDGAHWTPAEADARLRDGWFWHAGERPKTAEALMDMYLRSAGRGVGLLLDVPPDATGRIPREDADVLLEFRARRDAFLSRGLLQPGRVALSASGVRGGNETLYGPANVLDGDAGTYWTLDDEDDWETTAAAELEVDLGAACAVDSFITQEHIALGQRIGGYAIDAVVDGAFQTLVTGTSLGYKRIDRLDAPVETSRIRLRITQANATPLINSFQVLGVREGTA